MVNLKKVIILGVISCAMVFAFSSCASTVSSSIDENKSVVTNQSVVETDQDKDQNEENEALSVDYPKRRPYIDNHLYGYVDPEYNVVIQPIFGYAQEFVNGHAIVRENDNDLNKVHGKLGLINENGEFTFGLIYDELFRRGNYILGKKDDIYTLFDTDGNVVEIGSPELYGNIKYIDDEYIYYENLDESLHGTEAIVTTLAGDKLSYDYLYSISPYQGDFALVEYKVSDNYNTSYNRRYGFMNRSGHVQLGPFEFADNFIGGYALIIKENMFAYLNEDGSYFIEPTLEYANSFSDGYAALDSNGDGLYGYIDTNGQRVTKEIYVEAFDFKNGFAPIYNYVEDEQYHQSYYIINTEGDILTDFNPKILDIEEFSDGLAVMTYGSMTSSKDGYINSRGDIVIPCDFDWAFDFKDGIAHVKLNGVKFSIDKNGNRIGMNQNDDADNKPSADVLSEDKTQGDSSESNDDSITGVSLESGGDYTGDIENGMANGFGIETKTDSYIYKGTFKDNKWHGEGELEFYDSTRMIGTFVDGIPDGKFTIHYAYNHIDGYVSYVGDVYNFEFNGFGKLIYQEGEVYIGNFSNNKFNGQGSLVIDNVKYEGEFVNGLKKGIFKKTHYDGFFVEIKYDKDEEVWMRESWYNGDAIYEGDVVDGSASGLGTLTYVNGDFYKGEFKNGMFSGKGEFTAIDRYSLIGDFDNGECTYGTLIAINGLKYTGNFTNNKFIGEGTLSLPSNTVIKGEFNNVGNVNTDFVITYDSSNPYGYRKYEGWILLDINYSDYTISQDESKLFHKDGVLTMADGTVIGGFFYYGELQ